MVGGAKRLSGVFAAAITPLDAHARPDPTAAGAYCARLLADGCDGINLLGTTGEAASFTVAERVAVMEAVARAVDPRRCMVGTGASAFGDTLALTKSAVELGYGGALVIPPFYYKDLQRDDVVGWYSALIERVGDARLALYLYHFPALSGVPIEPELVEMLARRYPNTLAGLKDSDGAAGYAERLAADHPTLAIFPSNEARLRDARACGFAGCISATVQVAAPLARIVRDADAKAPSSSNDGDATHANDAFATLVAIRALLQRYRVISAVRHVAARVFADPALARAAAPVGALSTATGAALDAELAEIPFMAQRYAQVAR